MAAQDYPYDPTGEAASNAVTGEVHDLNRSAGVFPNAGPVYRDSVVIEGSYDGVNYLVLQAPFDYRPSPLFLRPSANLGREIVSYFVVSGQWRHVRLRYQALGQYEDTGLLSELAKLDFDRKDPTAWTRVRARPQVDPSSFKADWQGIGETEALNQGLEKIRATLERSRSQGDKATLAQVTALETRQSEVETLVNSAGADVNDLLVEYQDIWELYHVLEDYFTHGGQGNTAYPEGYLYNSDGLRTTHTVPHALGTLDLHLDFWALGDNGDYRPAQGDVVTVDANTVTLTTPTAQKVIGVVRPVGTTGVVYHEPTASSEHVITHNLNTGFPSLTVWVETASGWRISQEHTATLTDENTVTVALPSPAAVRVVVEPPVPNAFAYKSQPVADEHLITHYLGCRYFTATLWVDRGDGVYESVPNYGGMALPSLNHVEVTLPTPEQIKVVLHPVGVREVNFDQDILAKQVEIEDAQTRIETRLEQVRQAVALLSIQTTYDYDSTSASLVHTVKHDLDSPFVDATVWVLDSAGQYHIEYPNISIIDVNTVTISLTEAAQVHVLVRRGGA